MARRLIAAAAAMAVFAATPALAQTREELVGTYSLDVTSRSGPDCGGDTHLDLRVLSVGDNTLTFGDDSERHTASYNAEQKSFEFIEDQQRDGGGPGRLVGRFTREPDAVRLYVSVESARCNGQMTGTKAAPHQDPAPAAAAAMAAAQPGAPPPEMSANAKGIKELLFWVPLGALVVLVGGIVGYLVGRPKKKPDAES